MAERITQGLKAERLGISRSLYCRLVRDQVAISRASAQRMASIFGGRWPDYAVLTGADVDSLMDGLLINEREQVD